jgi:hypothetical protein
MGINVDLSDGALTDEEFADRSGESSTVPR